LALTFDSTGNLYVSDVSAPTQKIWMIAPDGSVTRTFGEADKLSFPNGLAIASDGSVNVADSNKGRVLIYPAGSNAPTALPPGTTEAPLGLPRGMAIDDRGRLYIVDTVNNMVNVYLPPDTAGGAPVFAFSFGKEGIEEGSFEFPNGIAVDGRGRIYITDRENNRLQVWSY
jgi:sugar lactone lactonase YvrE